MQRRQARQLVRDYVVEVKHEHPEYKVPEVRGEASARLREDFGDGLTEILSPFLEPLLDSLEGWLNA